MAPPFRPPHLTDLPASLSDCFSLNDDLPKTPDQREQQPADLGPPPPPRQTLKLRKKRTERALPTYELLDSIVPTIEMSEDTAEPSSPVNQMPFYDGFLAPTSGLHRFVTPPPKTPADRVTTPCHSSESAHEWDLINNSRASQRVCRAPSVFSDSSVSSRSSSGFSAQGLTSPESEATDPFTDDDLVGQEKPISSPGVSASPCVKRVKTHRNIKWTQAMDDHLWMTYMSYLADPTVTPFKMLPGTAPPLGVCHRVASKAKRTWCSYRTTSPSIEPTRDGTPDTVLPSDAAKQPLWPRSESATRRRLRTLCKRKPSLSAHYQRLLRRRSPSPFQSSSSVTQAPSPASTAAFSNRDLNVSLATATAPSMQPEGPLAQLASDPAEPSLPHRRRAQRPDGWFDRIGRSQAHQKSLSLHSGLGLDSEDLEAPSSLASPFDEIGSRSHLLHSMSTTKSLGRNNFKNGKKPSLDPPFEGDPTMRRSLKRRFMSDEEKPKRLPLEDVFSGEGNGGSSIVRNRGFSLGAVRASDSFIRLSTPQNGDPFGMATSEAPSLTTAASSAADLDMLEAPELPRFTDSGPFGSHSVPRRLAEPTPRLASPFVETSSSDRHFNTFPRSYIPTAANPQPFQQRLRQLAAEHAAKQSPK